jgi:hypothetical protein
MRSGWTGCWTFRDLKWPKLCYEPLAVVSNDVKCCNQLTVDVAQKSGGLLGSKKASCGTAKRFYVTLRVSEI